MSKIGDVPTAATTQLACHAAPRAQWHTRCHLWFCEGNPIAGGLAVLRIAPSPILAIQAPL